MISLLKRNFGKIHGTFTNRNDLRKANTSFWTKKKIIQSIFKSTDYKKKLILIAPHAFSDAPHVREGFFEDYYAHFKETLDFICENKLTNAILVKPHPSRKDYGE